MNTKSTSCSKHIDVKFHFVREKIVDFLILIEHTPMVSMLANPLTKCLPICLFQEHVTRMRLLGRLFVLVRVFFSCIFQGKLVLFLLLDAHFDVCHYLMFCVLLTK